MGCRRVVLLVLLATLSGGQIAGAGNNAGGSAYLTWDVAGLVPVLPQPVAQPFPLYLHLIGAPDVRALGVTMRWAPWDSAGACYSMVSGTSGQDCGTTVDTLPGGSLAGDATYTWSIRFAAGDVARDCVTYWFSKASCDTAPPAKFVLASIVALDGNGAVDTLANAGDAKFSGVAGADTSWWAETSARVPTPATFTLALCPNPATNEVHLDLTLRTREVIRLGIYDLAGRRVRQLEQGGTLGTGLHRYRWDLRDSSGQRVPSGTYFASAASSQGSRLMRIVVVR